MLYTHMLKYSMYMYSASGTVMFIRWWMYYIITPLFLCSLQVYTVKLYKVSLDLVQTYAKLHTGKNLNFTLYDIGIFLCEILCYKFDSVLLLDWTTCNACTDNSIISMTPDCNQLYGSTSQLNMGQVLNGCLYIRYTSQTQKNKAEEC